MLRKRHPILVGWSRRLTASQKSQILKMANIKNKIPSITGLITNAA